MLSNMLGQLVVAVTDRLGKSGPPWNNGLREEKKKIL